MKRWVWVVVVLLLAIGGGLAWFWSLGSLPDEQQDQIMLHVQQGPVQVRAPGASSFTDVSDGAVLQPGATVKTGSAAQATVIFFGRAESRLDANSELTVSAADDTNQDSAGLSVRLELGAGRVWSRVLRLFDLGSSFSVKTSSVVATVRGTAFDVRANADKTTDVWVSDSAVTIDTPQADEGMPAPAATTSSNSLVMHTQAILLINGKPFGSAPLTTPPQVVTGPVDVLQPTTVVSPADPVVSQTEVGAAVPVGQSALFGPDGHVLRHGPITVDARSSSWFIKNSAADELFERTQSTDRRTALARLGGARPDQPVDGLVRLSESLHLRFSKNKPALAEQYVTRRMAKIIETAEAGKSGAAAQAFARLENDIRARLNGPDAKEERRAVRFAVARVSLLLADVAPRSQLYPLKQRLEDLAVSLGADPSEILFAKLLAVDARLDETEQLIDQHAFDEARTALDAADGGIANARRDAPPVLSDAGPVKRRALVGKIIALMVRAAADRQRLGAAMSEASAPSPSTDVSVTSTATGVPTSTPRDLFPPGLPALPKPPTATTTTSPVTTGTPQYTSINVFIQPNPVNTGQSATILVLALKLDGKTVDVTSQSTFKLTQGVATISGGKITPLKGTTALALQATYVDGGIARTGVGSLTVSDTAAVLDGLTATAANPSLAPGGSTALTVMAHYSNGFTKQVTGQVTWTNQTPAMGSVAGNTFTANAQAAPGNADLTATYAEGGVTKTADVSITVTAPPPASTRTAPLN